ncbi:unnamed protein product [Pleuronectes platessa]|uniref:Uncharacterized protein n=1 Tax=Pleuronectes platessa TaxID=8262 RepID=A0A9N7VKT7_PLEPL|nr:unnamed protein product [Pleuronectes platessa]
MAGSSISLSLLSAPSRRTIHPSLFGSSPSETGHKTSWKELQATESGAFSTLGEGPRPNVNSDGVVNFCRSAEELAFRAEIHKDSLAGIKVARMTSWNVEHNDARVSDSMTRSLETTYPDHTGPRPPDSADFITSAASHLFFTPLIIRLAPHCQSSLCTADSPTLRSNPNTSPQHLFWSLFWSLPSSQPRSPVIVSECDKNNEVPTSRSGLYSQQEMTRNMCTKI